MEYRQAEVELIYFENEDVIATSSDFDASDWQ